MCNIDKVNIFNDSSRFLGWYTNSIEANAKKIPDLADCLPPLPPLENTT